MFELPTSLTRTKGRSAALFPSFPPGANSAGVAPRTAEPPGRSRRFRFLGAALDADLVPTRLNIFPGT